MYGIISLHFSCASLFAWMRASRCCLVSFRSLPGKSFGMIDPSWERRRNFVLPVLLQLYLVVQLYLLVVVQCTKLVKALLFELHVLGLLVVLDLGRSTFCL